jgi:predicted DNA-binding transcriptional regulator AlpA
MGQHRLIPLMEACHLHGDISRSTAYRRSKKGSFPPIRKSGGKAVVDSEELAQSIRRAPITSGPRGV